MAQQVLVAIDGSEHAKKALEYALEQFAEEAITAVYVIDPVEATYGGEYPSDTMLDAKQEQAGEILEEAEATAADRGIELDTESRIGRPAEEVVTCAEEVDADHIVVGSHGRTGLSRVLLGSVAETIVRRAPVPVTVVR